VRTGCTERRRTTSPTDSSKHVVDQLWEAGPPNENIGDAPRSSDEEVTRTIRRQLQLDSNTFANVMGGVGNRLAYISQDTHLRQIFNNTENQFDFRDVLDEDTVILFDLETFATTPPGS